MNLLVLDTATDRCTLACSIDGEVFENTRSIPRLHNEYLLEMLKELLDAAQIGARDLSAIGFAAGPGSFTGIRISAAVCQALALGANARVVPLSSSLLLAHAARRVGAVTESSEIETKPRTGVQTVLRSRAKFAYLASYDHNLNLLADDVLLGDEELRESLLPASWERVMDASEEDAAALGATSVALAAGDLLALTAKAVAAGEDLPPEAAQPRYVQGDTPWEPRL